MESIAFFEKKVSLTPSEFNQVKDNSIESLLETKAKQLIENKCSEQGFVLPGTMKLLSRSMGYFEPARFTGDVVYYVKLEGKVIYPADGVRVIGEVIRKNKMGLYVEYQKAIRIQVPRDLHIGSEEYEDVDVGDKVEVELKRSKFQINDPYILASAIFISKSSDNLTSKTIMGPSVIKQEEEEGQEEEQEEKQEEEQEGGENVSEEEEEESDQQQEEEEEESDQEQEEEELEEQSE